MPRTTTSISQASSSRAPSSQPTCEQWEILYETTFDVNGDFKNFETTQWAVQEFTRRGLKKLFKPVTSTAYTKLVVQFYNNMRSRSHFTFLKSLMTCVMDSMRTTRIMQAASPNYLHNSGLWIPFFTAMCAPWAIKLRGVIHLSGIVCFLQRPLVLHPFHHLGPDEQIMGRGNLEKDHHYQFLGVTFSFSTDTYYEKEGH
jgi:hypothetical protein